DLRLRPARRRPAGGGLSGRADEPAARPGRALPRGSRPAHRRAARAVHSRAAQLDRGLPPAAGVPGHAPAPERRELRARHAPHAAGTGEDAAGAARLSQRTRSTDTLLLNAFVSRISGTPSPSRSPSRSPSGPVPTPRSGPRTKPG